MEKRVSIAEHKSHADGHFAAASGNLASVADHLNARLSMGNVMDAAHELGAAQEQVEIATGHVKTLKWSSESDPHRAAAVHASTEAGDHLRLMSSHLKSAAGYAVAPIGPDDGLLAQHHLGAIQSHGTAAMSAINEARSHLL